MTRCAASELGELDLDPSAALIAEILAELEPPGSLEALFTELGITPPPPRRRRRQRQNRPNQRHPARNDAFAGP